MARKVLLADDSVTAQNMGRKILTDAGYEVTTVNNGSAALKKIAEQLPELIVLDVYMPGYSGLEVCQRLKEARETARIPVLLTVGKLEPFKPEDARRAKADAFVIKPFEASELLTALTRLEDKIVPQPAGQNAKAGSFAKGWAALEQQAADKGDKFGDPDAGWKNRLSVPRNAPREDEPAPEEASASDSKKKGKKEQVAAKAPAVTGIAPGLPADITPEEVAAIAAAAAAFEEKTQPAEFPVAAETAEPAPETAVVAIEVQASSKDEKAAVVEAPENKVEPAAAVESVAAPAGQVAATSAEAETKIEVDASVSKTAEPVASAAASGDNGAAATIPAEVPQAVVAEVVVATAAKGVHWVAQQVSLAPAEMGLILEQEMLKANVLLQAAGGDFSPVAIGETTPPPPVAIVAPDEPVKVEPVVEEKPAVVEAIEEPQPSASAPAVEPAAVAAEPVSAVPIAEPVPEPVAPAEATPVASIPEPVVPAAAAAEPALAEPVAAVAAAAAAGSSAIEAKVSEPAPEPASMAPLASDTPLPQSLRDKSQGEAELAAAWAQWKQVRESVVGPQLVSQVADATAAGIKESTSQTESQPDKEAAAATTPPGNPTAIANIVDSVLAELKPKLMEEIAKKLRKDKE